MHGLRAVATFETNIGVDSASRVQLDLASSSSRRAGNSDVVGGVVFAIRAAGTQGEVVPLAIVFVRLVPGVNANYPGKVTRVKVVNDHRMLV